MMTFSTRIPSQSNNYLATQSRLAAYKGLVDETLLNEIYSLADCLKGLQIVHYNTTVKGGGVAVMISNLLQIVNELGIQHRSRIVHLDETGCCFMAKLSELTQGGGTGELTEKVRASFIESLTSSLSSIPDDSADAYWIHDIQLLPVQSIQPKLQPAVWFCHVDTSSPNQSADEFIKEYLSDYNMCVYNTSISAFNDGESHSFETISLGIDPFKDKNREISLLEGESIIRECGIDTNRPVILQIARFGRFKNHNQAVDIYRIVKKIKPQAQLVLIGTMEADDDVEADEVYKDICRLAEGDSDIHLLCDPNTVGASQINAFQRYSDVVLQRSTREGFGLTVTEAMWKEQPVVATSATGFKFQIDHQRTGFISDDTETSAGYVLRLLNDRHLHRKMGEAAKEHVRKNFLVPAMVRDYLKLLKKVKGV